MKPTDDGRDAAIESPWRGYGVLVESKLPACIPK